MKQPLKNIQPVAAILHFFSRIDVILFLLCVVIFTGFPGIDLAISGLFYDASSGQFIYKDQPVIYSVYKLVSQLPFIFLVLLPILSLLAFRKYQKGDNRRIRSLFLLLCLLLGPGLLVNAILKDNSIGRARPIQVQEFNGEKNFTAAFQYSGECSRNCSFVSGHAAMGFFFITLGWIWASRRWFFIGFGIGAIVGLGRIIQGAHFMSDVTFAFWAVYLVASLLGLAFHLPHPISNPNVFSRFKTLLAR